MKLFSGSLYRIYVVFSQILNGYLIKIPSKLTITTFLTSII